MDTKIFMYTGKGGVGKSSISSATAILSAKRKKTILISIDPAHSLSDIFDINIGGEVTEVSENLSVIEFDGLKILEEKFPDIKNTLADKFRKIDFSKLTYTSSLDMPFIVNILSLIKILDIYEQGIYENIIVDCPASAATFAYLKYPEMLSWYLEKFFGVGKGIIRTLRPISKYKYKINLPDKESLDKVEIVYQRLLKLEKILKDSSIATVRLVGLCEKMVIEESKRDLAYLNLFDFNIDGFFVNRLLEDDESEFIKRRIEIQEKNLGEIAKIFYNIPIYKIKLMKKDMKSIDDLRDFADKLGVYEDLLTIKALESSHTYEKNGLGYLLKIRVDDVEDVEVSKTNSDINIRLNSVSRIISLPNLLIDTYIKSYELKDGFLIIYLEKSGELI